MTSAAEYLKIHNLTEASILDGSADAHHRLAYANIQPTAPAVAPTMTAAAAEFLGDRDPASLDEGSRAMLDHLNDNPIFKPKVEEPVAKAPALDTPIDWRTAKLDGPRLHSESASFRLEVANCFDRVQRVGPQNARETDLLLASQWVARAV